MPSTNTSPIRLCVLNGDGISPEITAATLGVLRAAAGIWQIEFAFEEVRGRAGAARRARHDIPGECVRSRQGGGRHHPRPGVAQRLSAGGTGRHQSVRRAAQAARPVRQHPARKDTRAISVALRQAGRSRHRAREHRRLLRRPQHVPRRGRHSGDARRCDLDAQDHASRLDAHRRGGVSPGDAAPPSRDRRAQGERAARLRRALPRMRACGRGALSAGEATRSGSSTRWRRCWCATRASST